MRKLKKHPIRLNMDYNPPVVHHYQPTHIVITSIKQGGIGKIEASLLPIARDGALESMAEAITLPITQEIAKLWHAFATKSVSEFEYLQLVDYIFRQLEINDSFAYSVK